MDKEQEDEKGWEQEMRRMINLCINISKGRGWSCVVDVLRNDFDEKNSTGTEVSAERRSCEQPSWSLRRGKWREYEQIEVVLEKKVMWAKSGLRSGGW